MYGHVVSVDRLQVIVARAPLVTELEARWGFITFAEHSMRYGAYALVWFVFAFFYVFMPNTKVRIMPALAGGILAGTVWQLTQWAYIQFQTGVSTYNAIYGTLAQLPVLMGPPR